MIKLDYSIESPEERKKIVEQILEEQPNPNSKYLELLADYLILCMEKQERKQKKLLTEKGKLVLELYNFSNYKGKSMIQLPVRESLRVKLFSEISATGKRENEFVLAQNLETGNGRLLQIMNNVPVCLIFPDEIKELAKKAGFKNTEFYADYKKSPFSSDSQKLVAVLTL